LVKGDQIGRKPERKNGEGIRKELLGKWGRERGRVKQEEKVRHLLKRTGRSREGRGGPSLSGNGS